ncbi:hypothetical protein EDB19DRAFT_1898410 [Suillus lakei]|nr:hypothetical protein EDB19DRAFT_1898410 [Suillus lakei]
MLCHACILQQHTHNPLHRVEEWHSTFFAWVSLKLLGLRIQLDKKKPCSHYQTCLVRDTAGNDFVVIDVHSIHEIGLDFCGCEIAQIHYKQIIHAQLFPATATNPQSAATFALMEFFHLLTFESKVSTYEFYHSIARWTDNTSTTQIRVSFMQMVHQWCHLKVLKRAGRGHDPSGMNATSTGECTILCPACPHPGKNLPKGWEDASHDIRWNENVDLSLNAGSCYFVEETGYKQYLRGAVKSTCVSHNAVNMADTKSLRGLAATGVGTMDCTRHNMKLPNGVGDLQKGEHTRYLNMDYLVFLVMVGFAIIIHFFVLKFHLNTHIQSCQTAFSFNFGKNIRCTDGEAPERGWVNINCMASSTKEMGPGACHNTLDDHFLDWNWKKVTMLSQSMLCKLNELQQSIPASSLSMWKLEIEAWEEDNAQPNPFKSRVTSVTQAAIHRQLAEKEAADLQAGVDVSFHTDILPSVLITSGIDLQDQQQCLAADISALGQHVTDTQKTKIFNQSNALQHRLDNWAQVQALYMPAVARICATEDACHSEGTAVLKPEKFKLWLPSQLDPHLSCDQKLCECEWEPRYAQAHDALNDVRQHICLFTHLNTFRTANVWGQHASTHACTALDLAVEKKNASKAKYNAAWDALTALSLTQKRTDMRPMGDFIQGQSEGTHNIPWIWKTPGVLQDNDKGLQDCLHIEWCKARAQEACWSEELLLLLEEMRRVLMFLTWQGTWCKGSRAYANRQSMLCEAMLDKFRQCWA